jgi:hypothetical protein
MKKKNSNNQRLTVYVFNPEHKKDFQTTYTYKNKITTTPITSIQDAIAVARTLHSLPTDTDAQITKKIRKVVFNGKEIQIFHTVGDHTDNGWVVK